MFYLIFGEDTYSSHKKIDALRDKYRTSCGDLNLIEINGQETNLDFLKNQALTLPFLANKRLLIIKNLSLAQGEIAEEFATYLHHIPDSTVIFFYEEKLDKKSKFYQALNKQKIVSEEYVPLIGYKLKNWITKEFNNVDFKVDEDLLNRLILSKTNLWSIEEDIKKIINYKIGQNKLQKKQDNQIKLAEVEDLLEEIPYLNVFNFIDSLIQKDLKKSLRNLETLFLMGEDSIRLLALVVSQFRNLVIIKDCLNRNSQISSSYIAKETGINPYIVSKQIGFAKRINWEETKKKYQLFYDFDLAIKTGQLEANLGLYLLTTRLCDNLNV